MAIHKKLRSLERQLMAAPRRVLLGTPSWKDDVPSVGGVYAIWSQKGKPQHVGETCHLKHRCKDLERTVNHTFREKMAVYYGMQRCSDDDLSKKLSKEFFYSFLPVDFGRKELEEYLVVKWKSSIINKPPKRFLLQKTDHD